MTRTKLLAVAALFFASPLALAAPSKTTQLPTSPKLGPGISSEDLQKVRPLSPAAKARLLERAGLRVPPSAIQGPVTLRPAQLYIDANAYAKVWGSSLVDPVPASGPGFARMESKHRGGIELDFRAAPDHAYLVDCTVARTARLKAQIADAGARTVVERPIEDGHFTHVLLPKPSNRKVWIMLSSDQLWDWSECSITPASL